MTVSSITGFEIQGSYLIDRRNKDSKDKNPFKLVDKFQDNINTTSRFFAPVQSKDLNEPEQIETDWTGTFTLTVKLKEPIPY